MPATAKSKKKRLVLADIPLPDASWDAISEFALTYDGYEENGSLERCAEIANTRRDETLADLRTCLFFEQRRYHHFGTPPDRENMAYIRSVVAKIREKVSPTEKISSWHVATAAEAMAAAQFARLGFDISVQYGANQPEYDLIIANGERILKVSVKGSQDGSWGLSQTQLSKLGKADYHGAADLWLERHKPGTVLCLVQFKNAKLEDLPRIYLASPSEIASRLKSASGGRGDTILFEDYTRGPKAAGAGTTEKLPNAWRLSLARINYLMNVVSGQPGHRP